MTAPAAPAAPTVAWTAPDALRIEWRSIAPPPAPALLSWSVQWRSSATADPPAAAGDWQARTGIDPAATAATIPDLAPGTAYDFQVRGANQTGDGAWSPSLTATTQETEPMAILQADLTELQIGLEGAATPGTLVAATRKIPYVSASWEPMVQRKTLEERGTVLADTTDVVVRRGSTLEITEELNTETIIAALMCALADVNSSASNSAREWVFTPAVTAPSGLRTATIEIAATDGASDNYRGRFGHARPTAISIDASTETAQLTTTWMGRRRVPLNSPAAVDAPARWVIPAALLSVSVDAAWADLGNTRVGTVRSLTVEIDPGLTEADALAGRPDLDAAYWRRGRIRGGVRLVVDHDGDTTGELTAYESGALRYIRIAATNGATGAGLRSLTLDLVGRYIDPPDVIAVDGSVHTLDMAAQLRADSDNNIMRATVVNGLSTF